MRASYILISKLKEFEGLRLRAYKDLVGVWTIGYGHTRGVKAGQTITENTLLKKICVKASTAEIQNEFKRWVYADGKKLPGLVRRRAWEAQRWAE